jgi:hypothetical protein
MTASRCCRSTFRRPRDASSPGLPYARSSASSRMWRPGAGIPAALADRDRLELEPEIPYARQEAVELRLVGHRADELGAASTGNGRHTVKGSNEPLAESAVDRDGDGRPAAHGRMALDAAGAGDPEEVGPLGRASTLVSRPRPANRRR